MKNLWLVLVLVAAGVVLFSFSLVQKRPTTLVIEETVPAPTQAAAQDPVTSPSIVTSPENGKEEGFTIQVYSFRDAIRAERALASLKAAGYKAFQEVSDLGEKGVYYRVRITGLADEAQAKAVLEDIRKNYEGGFIVKPKK